ncbi:MAG: DUF721 domain-containing protein [Verrucomicrobia bacterium]|nr:DUF721 domain-containing protein [Verrucomicrobiota bacterium]
MPFSKSTEDIIADFRGLPRSVSWSSKSLPVSLNNLLVVIKERYKIEAPCPERSLVENWSELFGKLAGRCNPVRIKDEHTLIISVTNPTLRSELNFKKLHILKKITALPYCSKIRERVIRG